MGFWPGKLGNLAGGAGLIVALCTAIMSTSCIAYSGSYFAPSAATGRIGYPQEVGSDFGLAPKNVIYFSPPNYEEISVAVRVSPVRGEWPFALQIDVEKLYFSDPRFKALPYALALKEIQDDRSEVIAESRFIEIDWPDGAKQFVPLAFPRQDGLRFVISGAPHGPARLPIPANMTIPLNKNNISSFSVKIPTMTFSGHRLVFPIIYFQKFDTDN